MMKNVNLRRIRLFKVFFKGPLNINVADANFAFMRIFFAFMIFALAFSGYAAVSHAMGEGSQVSMVKVDADTDTQTPNNSDKSSKSNCFDCTQCCTTAGVLSDNTFVPLAFGPAVLNSVLPHTLAQSRVFSLRRPPKYLV